MMDATPTSWHPDKVRDPAYRDPAYFSCRGCCKLCLMGLETLSFCPTDSFLDRPTRSRGSSSTTRTIRRMLKQSNQSKMFVLCVNSLLWVSTLCNSRCTTVVLRLLTGATRGSVHLSYLSFAFPVPRQGQLRVLVNVILCKINLCKRIHNCYSDVNSQYQDRI
jgi:hypothetical protein